MKISVILTRFAAFVTAVLLISEANCQQIQISGNGFTYDQNFNVNFSTGGQWTNGTTLNGWYAARSASGGQIYNAYSLNDGNTASHGLYSFGVVNDPDRALGSINQDPSGHIAYGVLFSNNSGVPINSIRVSLRAEQWRSVVTTKKGYQRVKMSYQVNNVIDVSAQGLLAAGAYTEVPEGCLVTRDTTSLAVGRNGNSPSYSAGFSVRIPVSIPNGSKFFLRFFDENGSNIDAALAVDDLRVEFFTADEDHISVLSDYPFYSYLDQGILADIPTELSAPDLYTVPTPAEFANWQTILTDFFNGNNSSQLSGFGYKWTEFTCNGTGKTYQVLRKTNQSNRYWGTYVRKLQPNTATLTIQAPHPNRDVATENQATAVFESVDASTLMIAGTERCNSSAFSACSGATDVCGSNQKFRKSDVAHDIESIFHLATVVLANSDPDMKFVQLHGFTKGVNDPNFIVSAGIQYSMEKSGIDYPALVREGLLNSTIPGKVVNIPHLHNTSALAGQDNVQGRFLNNYPWDICVDDFNTPSATNRFLHIEQYKLARIDPRYYSDMASILEDAFGSEDDFQQFISIDDPNITYEQDFNSLASQNGQPAPWANNLTIEGWYAAHSNGMFGDYRVESGSTPNFGIYSFGIDGDRALGSLNDDDNGHIVYGALFRNNSGRTIQNIEVNYRAEQWRAANTTFIQQQRVRFSYKIFSSANPTPSWMLNNGQFTSVNAGDLTSIVHDSQNGEATDGNVQFNQVSTQFPVSLEDGEYIFIRFYDQNIGDADHAIALDDFTITFSNDDQLILNEVLGRGEAPEDAVDANGDGIVGGPLDDMMELVNRDVNPLDISGWKVGDDVARFEFPPGTLLAPGEAVVVFGGWGGGSPVPTRINGSKVFFSADPDGLSLDINGYQLNIWNAADEVTGTYYYIPMGSQSLTRIPDVTGSFDVHPSFNDKYFSPGIRQDGGVFNTQIKFTVNTANVSEASGNYQLHITVLNAIGVSGSVGFDVELDGDGSGLGGFSLNHYNVPFNQPITDFVINLPVANDQVLATNKDYNFFLKNISGGSSAAIVEPSQFTLTVVEDDITSVYFESTSATVSETGSFELPIVINLPSGDNPTFAELVLYNSTGDAIDINNFPGVMLQFQPGNSSADVAPIITITDDILAENDEVFVFRLQNISGGASAVLGDNIEFTLTIERNDIPAFVINEVHGRLQSDDVDTPQIEGDPNGDGARSPVNDEFIEFVNKGEDLINISGWKVTTGNEIVQHRFHSNTLIQAGSAVVLFGGPSLAGDGTYNPSNFGGATVTTADSNGDTPGGAIGLSLLDNGTIVKIYDQNDVLIDAITYVDEGLTTGISVGRSPDMIGEFLMVDEAATPNHPDLNGKKYSPGFRADGLPFVTNVKFSLSSATVNESEGAYDIGFTVINPSLIYPIVFDLTLSGDNTDLNGYETTQIVIPPGATAFSKTITITNPSDPENTEVFNFHIEFVGGGLSAVGIDPSAFELTIEDNDMTIVSFSTASATVSESGVYEIPISILYPALAETQVDVVYLSGPQEDVAGFAMQDVIIPGGQAEAIATITITDDLIAEEDEIIKFYLTNPQGGLGATLGSITEFTLTIQRNDIPPVVINEIHGRLAAGLPLGDTNGDGIRNTTNDEFIEFVNDGPNAINMSGWKVRTGADLLQHIFYSNSVVPAGAAMLLFGGPFQAGAGTYNSSNFGGAIVQGADDNGDDASGASGLSLLDAGTTIKLFDQNNVLIASHTYSDPGNAGISVTRNPDATGALSLTPNHPTQNGKNYSAGLKIDGAPFRTNVRFTAASSLVSESAATYNISVTLINPGAPTEFDLVFTGSANGGNNGDLNGFSIRHIVVPANQNFWNEVITITNDDVLEQNEIFSFRIENVTGGKSAFLINPSVFDLTIQNDDFTRVSFVNTSIEISEDIGAIQIPVSIANAGPQTTVQVQLTNGDAGDLTSYAVANLTFPLNNSAIQFAQFTIANDNLLEDDEVLEFSLVNPAGGVNTTIGQNQIMTVTIRKSDVPPLVLSELFPDPTGVDANGDEEFNEFDEFIELVNIGQIDLDVSGFKVGDGVARFIFPEQSIIKAGEAVLVFGGYSGTAPERIHGVRMFVSSDPGQLSLDNNNGVANIWASNNIPIATQAYAGLQAGRSLTRPPDLSDNFAEHQLLNSRHISPGRKEDGTLFTTQLKFASEGVTVSEIAGTYNLHVTLLNPTGAVANTTFNVALIDGEASELGNYSVQAKSIAVGINDIIVPITITDNHIINQAKQYTFEIQNVGGGLSAAFVSPFQFVLTVTSDDVTEISFADASASASESSGTFNIHFDIVNPDQPVEFDLLLTGSSNGGINSDLNDYSIRHVVVPANHSSWSENMVISKDEVLEPDEVFTFEIQNVTGGYGAKVTAPSTFDLTIQNDDFTKLSFVNVSGEISEGGTIQIPVSIVNFSALTETTVQVQLIGGDQNDLLNYAVDELTFDVNSSETQLAEFSIADDDLFEDTEELQFRLVNPVGGVNATPGENQIYSLTIHKSDVPSLIISEIFPLPLETDANGDGQSDPNTDEAIELVNTGNASLDVGGWKVGDENVRFIFPNETVLMPGEAVVVFGGYAGIAPSRINGTRMFVGSDANGLGLDDVSDDVNVWSANDILVTSQNYSDPQADHSFTRPADLSGNFVSHQALDGVFLSPGIKANGTVFTTQVRFAIGNASVSESSGSYDLHVKLYNPNDVFENTTFSIALIQGNASELGNYSTQLKDIGPDENEIDIVIPILINSDDLANANKVYTFAIQDLNGGFSPAVASPATFELTVTNDDVTAIEFAQGPMSVTEEAGTVNFAVSITNPSPDHETTVEVQLLTGDAADIGNYQTTVLHFPAGSSQPQVVNLNISNDEIFENDEQFVFRLANVMTNGESALIGNNGTFTITIEENDIEVIDDTPATVSFVSTSTSVVEDVGTVNFHVSIINPSPDHETTVEVLLLSGDATDIGNYQTTVLHFPPGSSQNQVVNLNISNDDIFESDEQFVFRLANVMTNEESALIGSNDAFTLTIEENDSPVEQILPTISFASAATEVTEDVGTVQLLVTVEHPSPDNVTTVEVKLTGGEIGDINNYETTFVSFPAGSAQTQLVTVTVTDDAVRENDEQFTFALLNPTTGAKNAALGTNHTHVLTIKKNDDITGLEPEVIARTRVYPNPASSVINVSVPDQSLVYDFIMSDLNGRTVVNRKTQSGNITINTDNVTNGIFIYRITTSKEGELVKSGKLWLQR